MMNRIVTTGLGRLSFLVVFVLIACSGNGQQGSEENNQIVLSGTVGYPQADGIIKLEEMNGRQATALDTISIDPETYTYSKEIQLPNPGIYRLNFYNKQFVMLVLDDEDVVVNVDGNSRTGFTEIKGSSDHELLNKIQQKAQSFQQSEEFKTINEEFNKAAQAGNQELMSELQDQFMKSKNKHDQEVAEIMKSAPASLATMELLKGGQVLDKDNFYETYQVVSDKLNEEYGDLESVQEFDKMVEDMAKLAIGQVAPEIALPNPEGEVVKLSSLRGNYVLVDFWAKWCKPCRMENPNVVRMYNKYNEKGFEVYGVSLDRNKQDWLQAIEEDELHWTQVSDLKFWQSEAAKTYNITAIPFALLLDPDGKIIAKNLRGRALENKLAELLEE